jgi:hypothetical protein
MQLSDKAIQDLKSELMNKYGCTFDLSDEEVNEIGCLLLTILAESLKMKIANPELPTVSL